MSTRIPLTESLARTRCTPAQTAKAKPEKRLKNVERAFEIRPSAGVAWKTVLLVDDVMTTGATLDQAAQALLKGGAASVLGAVVAAAHAGGSP